MPMIFTIRKYIPPLILLFGLMGNIWSFAVYRRETMKHSVMGVFLRALAIVDNFVLVTVYPYIWLQFVYHMDVMAKSIYICKTLHFLQGWSLDMSGCVLAVISVERLIGIWLPYRHKLWYTQTKAVIILAILGIAVAAIETTKIINFKIISHTTPHNISIQWCTIEKNMILFIWQEFCMIFMLPSLIIIICNACIMYRFAIAARARSQLSHVTKKRNVSTALTLFAISLVYLISTGSCCIYVLLLQIGVIHTHNVKVYSVMLILLPTNSAVNFLLYSATGTQFRAEVKAMLCEMWPCSCIKGHQPRDECERSATRSTTMQSTTV